MLCHHLVAFSSGLLLFALVAQAGSPPQSAPATPQGVRIHRAVPAAVLRPVEVAARGASGEQLASSANPMSAERTHRRADAAEASLRPERPLEASRAAISKGEVINSPRLADRWLPPARLYTVSSRSP
jgi:hypothetical protein